MLGTELFQKFRVMAGTVVQKEDKLPVFGDFRSYLERDFLNEIGKNYGVKVGKDSLSRQNAFARHRSEYCYLFVANVDVDDNPAPS